MKSSSIYDTKEIGPDEGAGAAGRLLDILEFLETQNDARTLTEITVALSLPKASAHRLLTTLRTRGYVFQERPRSGYRLGLRLLRLAARVRERLDLAQVAQPFLEQLARKTGESCQLSVLSGSQALCVARAVSPEHPGVSLTGLVGSIFPLHAAAVGKVLLAYAPLPEQERYLAQNLATYTPRTHIAPETLASELQAVCLAGLAHDREEYKRGLSALAAPIFDESGHVAAALALPFLAGGGEADSAFKATSLRDTARSISRALGFHEKSNQEKNNTK